MKRNETDLWSVCKLLKTWWPGTESNRRRQPFQGRLANEPSRLESIQPIAVERFTEVPFGTVWDDVGCFRPFDVRLLFDNLGAPERRA